MLQYFAASLANGGQVLVDLPNLDLGDNGATARTISNTETITATLHLDYSSPEDWQNYVREGATLIAAYDDNDPGKTPVWVGYVTSVTLDGASNDVALSLATFEAVPDRMYVGDQAYTTSQGRNEIVADLVANWYGPDWTLPLAVVAVPFGDPGPVPAELDSAAGYGFVFQNTDNETLKQRIDEVCAQLGGEYTIEWAYVTDGSTGAEGLAIAPTLYVGGAIGNITAGTTPPVTFDLPGSLVGFTQTRDYSQGAGANQVIASSTPLDGSVPISETVNAPLEGRPVWQYRYTPASAVSPGTLDQYAQQAIKVLGPGARPITMTALLDDTGGRRLGVDWVLGDLIGYSLAATYVDDAGNTVVNRAFPGGLSGVGRCIGYQLTDSTITLILADAAVYVGN